MSTEILISPDLKRIGEIIATAAEVAHDQLAEEHEREAKNQIEEVGAIDTRRFIDTTTARDAYTSGGNRAIDIKSDATGYSDIVERGRRANPGTSRGSRIDTEGRFPYERTGEAVEGRAGGFLDNLAREVGAR